MNPRRFLTPGLVVALIATGILSAGCIDLALIGLSAAVRHEQNQKRIQAEREIDAQREARDQATWERMYRLERQNEELLRQRGQSGSSTWVAR